MNSEHTPLSVSLGDMPVTSDETDTVLSKSDGVTMGDGPTVDGFYPHPDNATYARKRFDAITRPVRGMSTDKLDMNELNESPYLLPELNTDNLKRSTDGNIDFDYEFQKAMTRTPHRNLRVPKHPLPVGKGLVTSIMGLSRFDSTIWARLDKLGYDVKPLKRLKKTNRMGMKEYLGAYFSRPVLEQLYQLALNDGCY